MAITSGSPEQGDRNGTAPSKEKNDSVSTPADQQIAQCDPVSATENGAVGKSPVSADLPDAAAHSVAEEMSAAESPQSGEDADLIPSHAERVKDALQAAKIEENTSSGEQGKELAKPTPAVSSKAKLNASPEPAKSQPAAQSISSSTQSPEVLVSLQKPAAPMSDGAAAAAKPVQVVASGSTAEKGSGDTSLGVAWDALEDSEPVSRRWYAGGISFLLIVVAVLVVKIVVNARLEPALFEVPQFTGSVADAQGDHTQTVLNEMERVKATPQLWPMVEENAPQSTAPRKADAGADTGKPRRSQKRSTHKTGADASPAQSDVRPDFVGKRYESFFGSAAAYHESSIRTGGAVAPSKTAQQTPASNAVGTLLYAELQDAVASRPDGAAVIAKLTHEAVLAGRVFPAGIEIHGAVSGSTEQDARIHITFSLLRFADGKTFEINGSARDSKGLAGVPGTKPLTGATVGSVALAGGTRAMEHAGQQLPFVGSLLAAAAQGAGESGKEKIQRMDRDTVIVMADKGTKIQIYVHSVVADQN